MTKPLTTRDIQRVTFVESLHNSLKKQAKQAIADHQRFITLASSYILDGLEESECVELLMIDGLSRDASEGCVAIALNNNENNKVEILPQYSFQFEDPYGKVWSSYDVGKVIEASTEDEAWMKAEEMIDESSEDPSKVLSVTRIK